MFDFHQKHYGWKELLVVVFLTDLQISQTDSVQEKQNRSVQQPQVHKQTL